MPGRWRIVSHFPRLDTGTRYGGSRRRAVRREVPARGRDVGESAIVTTRGFLLGNFMPPHAGHVALCRMAAALVDQLTVMVCTLDSEPMPAGLRAA